MKNFLAVSLAAIMLLSMSAPAFAETKATQNIALLSGNAIDENGVQFKDAGTAVVPNQTIYFMLPTTAANYLSNAKNGKFAFRKVTNGKLVKSIKLVEKKLASAGTYTIPTGATAPNATESVAANLRRSYIAVELNDTTSSDEFKVELTATFTAKTATVAFNCGTGIASSQYGELPNSALAVGDKLPLKISFYVANSQDVGDASITVGTKGVTIKPVSNQENEVIFESEDTMATLKFMANSNPDKFYAKLTTKWTSDLLSKFKNTDAVIRRFSAANIDSTSRATLSLNNPFGDDVDPDEVYIYTVNSKGKLSNATSSFSYDSDEDAFTTRTRALGTWIISNAKVSIK